MGWRDGSVIKSMDCFSREPEFNSQQYMVSHNHLPTPGPDALFCHADRADTYFLKKILKKLFYCLQWSRCIFVDSSLGKGEIICLPSSLVKHWNLAAVDLSPWKQRAQALLFPLSSEGSSTDIPHAIVGSTELSTLHSRGRTHLLRKFFSSVQIQVHLQGKKQGWFHLSKKRNLSYWTGMLQSSNCQEHEVFLKMRRMTLVQVFTSLQVEQHWMSCIPLFPGEESCKNEVSSQCS